MSATDASAVTDAARSCVRSLDPYLPGARPAEEGERVCRLASNENPLGPSPAALEALAGSAALARYPDNDCHALRAALGAHHDCPADCLLFGNGSSDLLSLVAAAYLESGRSAVFARHAFVVYPLVVRAAGARARVAEAHPPGHASPLGHDPQALLEEMADDVSVVFVANPNNPTGTLLDDDELRTLLAQLPPDVVVVVDEAYAEYLDPVPSATRFLDDARVIVTRTFSKAYGLAGLRIGYAVAHPQVVDMLNRVRQPFNVNTPAQNAAVAALGDAAHLQRSRTTCREGLLRLQAAASSLDLPMLGTHGNFLTLHFGEGGREFFAEHDILVRTLDEYELPGWLRITIGSTEEMSTVIEALESWT